MSLVKLYKAVRKKTSWRIAAIEVEEKEKTYRWPSKGDSGGDFRYSQIFRKEDEGRAFFLDKMRAVEYAIETKLKLRKTLQQKLEECQMDLLWLQRLKRKAHKGRRKP